LGSKAAWRGAAIVRRLELFFGAFSTPYFSDFRLSVEKTSLLNAQEVQVEVARAAMPCLATHRSLSAWSIHVRMFSGFCDVLAIRM
jgi:hypothetical protein